MTSKHFFAALALLLSLSAHGQTDWKRIGRLLENGSARTAYLQSEAVYKKTKDGTELLTAAWYMTRAASAYQEDWHDSAQARYRTILPRLDAVNQAVCYAFLGQNDSALRDEELLKQTPSDRLRPFCLGATKGLNLTPTAFDVVAQTILARDFTNTALLQRLIDFHCGDADDIRLNLDIEMMDVLVHTSPNQSSREQHLLRLIDKYRTSACPRVATLYHQLAAHFDATGREVQAVRYCDSAIARFPKSEGGASCANLKAAICRARIDISGWEGECAAYPGSPSLHSLSCANLSRLHFALYAYDGTGFERFVRRLPKPLRQWKVNVHDDGSHRSRKLIFDIPPLSAGRYLLMVSADEKFDKDDAYLTLQCIDFALCNLTAGDYLMVDALTGAPIEGQAVVLLNNKGKPSDTLVTRPDGRFSLPYEQSCRVRIERAGGVFEEELWYSYHGNSKHVFQPNAKPLADRPLYRPGDTVHYAALLYETDNVDGRILPNRGVTLTLSDPNDKVRERLALFADSHGVVSATFVLPADALAGTWTVKLSSGNVRRWLPLRVEEYRQPKFMVSIREDAAEVPVFGRLYTLRGVAQAYSGANLSGAKVKYTVSRRTGWYRWWSGATQSTYTFYDSTITAADGSFEISFTPQPDSSVDFSRNPIFEYSILIEVTDLNGETHEATTTLSIGFQNERIRLSANLDNFDAPTLSYSYSDLNGHPLQGDVTLRVLRLHTPDSLRLTPEILYKNSSAMMSLGRDDFHRLFPNYCYTAFENNPSSWSVEKEYVIHHHADGSKDNYSVDVDAKELHSGVYRIIALAGEATDTQYTTLVLPRERTLPTADLLWSEVSEKSVEVGGRITVRYASAFDDTRLYYLLYDAEGNEITSQWLPADPRIRSFSIPVDSSMLGGFRVVFLTVREGVRVDSYHNIDVPFSHKRLDVDITTFRDKLQPGAQEEWTIKVTELQSGKGTTTLANPATLVMAMYDDALNSFGTNNIWSFYPWRKASYSHHRWQNVDCDAGSYADSYKVLNYNDPESYKLILDDGILGFYHGRNNRRMYKNALASPKSVALSVDAVEEEECVFATARGEGDMASASQDAPTIMPSVRTNLNTFAFFVSDLITDAGGTATYRFRVPELLTRWYIRGLAFTDDLKIGTLDKKLVTSKPLMVQPNIPRFLRHGDSLVLMAKVLINEDFGLMDEKVHVKVKFLLSDAATGATLSQHTTHVMVKDATQVTFPIRVPKDVYVVTYQIIATAEGMSDGERGHIPVVSNRQSVTLAKAVYLNGPGQKTFHFPLSAFRSPSAQPLLLGAEIVNNPMWLAVKAMPYLKQTENPSNLYLANRLYVNTLGYEVIKELKGLRELKSISDTANTRLKINEDVKQILLEATPWLREAESEVEQRQAIANYFDTIRLQQEFAALNSQLTARQNADGGWSWMPEGESSLWVTRQVLKRLAPCVSTMSRQSEQALAFVDKEEQQHYVKYIKPYLQKGAKWEPDNIDYLYTRSFYGKGKSEAYRYYYSNALKHYKSYTGLYTQAQLALIFHRHGDKQAARELVRRLKEKSLVSDEMGMYWRDNRSGWCWNERPIETQALLIQAFTEVTPKDTVSLALMRQWLLKQKQATHWGNDQATVEAISALTMGNGDWKNQKESSRMKVCGAELTGPSEGLEGYRSQRWEGGALDSIMALGDSTITLRKETGGIVWGAVYYQYTDDMDKIPVAESGITLKRSYSKRENLKVGDRVTVRIEISCDRTMEYLELIDGRPSCMEPVSTRAGWCWNQGLRYYVEVKNTATHCYINRLEKGKYVVEYDVFVTNPGTFLAGPVTMQCMYAPEFRAIAPAERFVIGT